MANFYPVYMKMDQDLLDKYHWSFAIYIVDFWTLHQVHSPISDRLVNIYAIPPTHIAFVEL